LFLIEIACNINICKQIVFTVHINHILSNLCWFRNCWGHVYGNFK